MKIELNDSYLVNKGTNRACYIHPHDAQKCIKITFSGNFKETNREIKYYNFLKKRAVSWDMLALYYGNVDTNLGEGECVEIIKDYNGNISKDLDKYIFDGAIDKEIPNIVELLSKLKKYLYQEKIYVKDLNPINIVYKKFNETEGKLVIIDGLAHSNYIPFSMNIDSYVLKKIDSSWKNLSFTLNKRKPFRENNIIQDKLKKNNILSS